MDWKLPEDAEFYYRPRKLKDFLGFANRLAIKKLQRATKPSWSGKLLLCGPRRSGLTTLLTLIARDANGVTPSRKYFKVRPEVEWETPRAGISMFENGRQTVFVDAKLATADHLKDTLSKPQHPDKRYMLIDHLECIKDPSCISSLCSYINQTLDDVIAAVHYEESEPTLRDQLRADLGSAMKIIPISYPESDSVQLLYDDLSELGVIEAWDSMVPLAQGQLTKLVWLLGDGGDRGMLDYIDKLEELIEETEWFEKTSSTEHG